MRRAIRLSYLISIFFAVTCLTRVSIADDVWNAPAFSQQPKALLKASEAFPPDTKTGATVLLNEMNFRFEADGRSHWSNHTIYRIDNNEAIRRLSAVSVIWQPWYQKQPVIRARVIAPNGEVHPLDASLLRDSPAFEQRPELFDDIRVLGAPLPAVSVGCLVEIEEIHEDSQTKFPGGIVHPLYLGNMDPVKNTSIVIDAPESLPLRYELYQLPNARVNRLVQGGRIHLTIEQGPLAAIESIPLFTPADVAPLPELRFSTGQSWKDVAAKYSALAEPQIRVADVDPLVTKIAEQKKDRYALILALVQKLHEQVRYTGVEFGISSYVPQPPSAVLARHYGDCKDKATVLVAMLRAAKIPAYLALLAPGVGEDVRPALPGFGSFTHAIVYVPGAPDLWIDATDEYAQPNELPAFDQGRLALIVRDTTTELVKTPVSRFDQNVWIDRREVSFQESGPANVSESFAARGTFDEALRRRCDLSNEKSLRETYLDHVKREFGADAITNFSHSQPRDLGKPIQVSLTLDKAPYASVSAQVAVVWMQSPPIREWLPYQLFTDFSSSESEENKPPPPRTIDFVLPEAFVREWQYHLTPPPGFQLRSLPSDETQQLAPARIVETYKQEVGGAVLATMRFELPEQRLTPQEARSLVRAVEELEKQEAKGIFFDKKASVLLAEGKVKDSLAEYRRLIALHPKEALHHSEIAEALLSAGLGDAARKEARLATELEPASSPAWVELGYVLEYDLLGRRFKEGFDRAGAIKAYDKAIALDPKNAAVLYRLAVLHEFNDRGERYAANAELETALKEYKTLETLPDKDKDADEAELYCLYFAGHLSETLAKAATLPATYTSLGVRIAALTLSKNPQAGVELARSQASDAKQQSAALIQASSLLVKQRHYPEAAPLEAAGVELSDEPAKYAEQLDTLRKVQPYQQILFSKADPRWAVQRVFLAAFGKEKIAPSDVYSHLVIDDQKRDEIDSELTRAFGRAGVPKGYDGYSDDVALDWLFSTFHYAVDGSDNLGYRIRMRIGTGQSTAFVIREGSEWKLLQLGHGVAPAGLAALAAIDRGDLAGARQWIDWGREEMEIRSNDDPLSGPRFPLMWRKGQAADAAALKTVAAVMVSGSTWSASSIPVLQPALARTSDPADHRNLQLALCSALVRTQGWPQLAPIAEDLVKDSPQSATAFHYLATAYIHLEAWNDLERIAHQRLQRLPDDLAVVRSLARADFARGRLQSGRQRLKPLLDDPRATAGDLNDYAWAALFTRDDESGAVEIAQRAASMTAQRNYDILHTLACLYADTGREREARQTLLQAMEAKHLLEPDDVIWFGLGRIADEYGERQAALDAYNRVQPPASLESKPISTWALAKERIRMLQIAGTTTAAAR